MATQYTAGLSSGQVLTAATMNSIGAAWESWTPVLTNATVGNGTIVGAYTRINKLVVARWVFTLGSTSSVSNYIAATLPVTAASGVFSGNVIYQDASPGASYPGYIDPSSGTTLIVIGSLNAAGTFVVGSGLSPTVPFTWTTNDKIIVQITYEAA